MKRPVFLGAAILALAGCNKGALLTGADLPRETLSVHPVDYNPNKTDLGKVAAVADLGQNTAVFSDKGLSVMVAGTVTGNDQSITAWSSAGVIPAADGEGDWVAGVDDLGDVYTIDPFYQLQPISDRYGLLGQKVHAVASLGAPSAAFLLDSSVAIADGTNVTKYDLSVTSFDANKGRVAGIGKDTVHVFDVATGKDSAYEVPGVLFVTFDNNGKVVAASAHQLYAEGDDGAIEAVADLSKSTVHGLANSPSGVWLALGSELALYTGDKLATTSGANLPSDAVLSGSSSGDAWALSGGSLSRYSATPAGDESQWEMTVLPIFTKVCSQCHLPGGTANIDLSYYGAWVERRALVGQRVIDQKPSPMPPLSASVQLTADDVAAIKAWVGAGK
jgi:hypothetical protein